MQNSFSRLYYWPQHSLTGEWTMKTAKPTANELEMAIVAAEQDLNSGQDAHHVATALLYLYRRQQDLEMIRDAAERLVQSGQDEGRLTALTQALEAASANELEHSG